MLSKKISMIFLLPLILSSIVLLSSTKDVREKEILMSTQNSLKDETLKPVKSTISVQNNFSNTLTATNTDTNVTKNDNETIEDDCADYIQFYGFTLYSPINRTYYSKVVPLEISFTAALGTKYTLSYTLDGTLEGDIPFEVENSTELHITYPAKGYLMLPELSEGSHNLTINLFASASYGSPHFTGSVQFTIDTQSQPNDIPEFKSTPLLLFIMSTTAIVVLLRKKSITQKGDNKEK